MRSVKKTRRAVLSAARRERRCKRACGGEASRGSEGEDGVGAGSLARPWMEGERSSVSMRAAIREEET